MIRRNPIMAIVWTLGLLIILDLLLLVSGFRILVGEDEWSEYLPYSKFTTPTEIDSGIECSYFTGRSIQTARVSWSRAGIDECPFIISTP